MEPNLRVAVPVCLQFPQDGDVRFSFDPVATVASRVRTVVVDEPDGARPIDRTRVRMRDMRAPTGPDPDSAATRR